ncbi:unnamed protein product [Pleuronectes platessa]|uniref:Cilia- and flagella-associated protein 206 n=1 Tax=Pleuronectes platessa TaxID=8262 RepID=A0A9N7YRY5_PLEPL|nr:unnamed protein product [Pleuronectes platessa]
MQPADNLPVKPITKCESSTQTDLHPVGTNIVKSYEWNEWELRRKAIRQANLRTKVTHSAQTDLSHMRRENITQTWLPKDAACQSKRDDLWMNNQEADVKSITKSAFLHLKTISRHRPSLPDCGRNLHSFTSCLDY